MCPRCGRPARVCLCAHVSRVAVATKLVVLQHPREAGVPIGTVRLLELGLDGVERHVGVTFPEDGPVATSLGTAAATPVLLYPGPGARDLEAEPPPAPVTLVVVDGTWWQAQKLLKKNPWLARLPRYSLSPRVPSRYRIRREPAAHCVSTIEAVVEALFVLEGGNPKVRALLAPFDALVEHQLAFARDNPMRRHLSRPARPRRTPGLRGLLEREPDLVVGYGEANAWPRGTPLGHCPEIVHFAAERVATGERFESVIAPRHPLSPTFTHHTGIDGAVLQGGESFASFSERWDAFLRPTDLLCGWGFFPSERLRAEGARLPERLDVRPMARRIFRPRPLELERCAELLVERVPAPWVQGRTGLRLAALTGLLAGLVLRARNEA